MDNEYIPDNCKFQILSIYLYVRDVAESAPTVDSNLEDTLMEYLASAKQSTFDPAISGFLTQLGDILQRLPYKNRRSLQVQLMNFAIEMEESLE